GPALYGVRGKVMTGAMQQAEPTCPPATLGVQSGPGGEQNIEHLGTAYVDNCWRFEWADGFIDPGLELGMAIKDLPNDFGFIAPECQFQFFHGVGCLHRINPQR